MIILIIVMFIISACICIVGILTVGYQVNREANTSSKKIGFNEFRKLFESETWVHPFYEDHPSLPYNKIFENEINDSKVFCSEFKIKSSKYFFSNVFEYYKWRRYIKWHENNNLSKCKTTTKEVEARLNETLTRLCEQLKIPLSYHDSLNNAAGQILYHSKHGRYILDNCSIQILEECKESPYVLAHELGHYMGIKDGDRSEERADKEAHKLIKSILTDIEYLTIYTALRVRYEDWM